MAILNLNQTDFEPQNGQDVCLAFGNQPKHWKLPRTIMANLTMMMIIVWVDIMIMIMIMIIMNIMIFMILILIL